MVIEVIFVVMCLLVPQAKGLKCTTCKGASCFEQHSSQDCPMYLTDCATSTIRTTFLGTSKGVELASDKSCYRSAQCLNGSLNLGTLRVTLSTLCCNKDNCNDRTPPVAAKDKLNGKFCYMCPVFGSWCSMWLPCRGDEDRCFSAKGRIAGKNATVKGCVTKNACSGGVSKALDSMAEGLRCCKGNLCNSAWSATHSVLFLLWPLGSVLLFH